MAVDDESFYNVIGEEISREKILTELINFSSLLRDVADTRVTASTEGSEISNTLDAIALLCS